MRIFKEFSFDSAHHLPNVPSGHKCGRIHGHTYRLRVWCQGEPGIESGWVVDYGDIALHVGSVLLDLDHKCLNHVDGLQNPTTELLAVWIYKRLYGLLPLHSIEVYESASTGCVYDGGDA